MIYDVRLYATSCLHVESKMLLCRMDSRVTDFPFRFPRYPRTHWFHFSSSSTSTSVSSSPSCHPSNFSFGFVFRFFAATLPTPPPSRPPTLLFLSSPVLFPYYFSICCVFLISPFVVFPWFLDLLCFLDAVRPFKNVCFIIWFRFKECPFFIHYRLDD